MAAMFLQKYFIYDPGVRLGDELGRLRVRIEKEEDGVFFLATPQQAQCWIDQGLAGKEPLSKLSGAAKSLLKQITRGRSEDPGRLAEAGAEDMTSGRSPALPASRSEPRIAAREEGTEARRQEGQDNSAEAEASDPDADGVVVWRRTTSTIPHWICGQTFGMAASPLIPCASAWIATPARCSPGGITSIQSHAVDLLDKYHERVLRRWAAHSCRT